MSKTRVFLIVLLLSTSALVSGCVAVVVGVGAAGTVAYIRGDLEVEEDKSIDDVYAATVKALDDLELNVITKGKDAMSAVIVVRDAQDKKIKIKLTAVGKDMTKLSIRIGAFGSETKSMRIYDQIKKNLE